jgi:hypothetical protein
LKHYHYILILSLGLSIISCKSTSPVPPVFKPELDFFRKNIPDSLKHLLPILDSVYYNDQLLRGKKNRDYFLKNKKLARSLDSVNILIVDSVVSKYGILGIKDIGYYGHFAITMTIQHTDFEIQKKYLPLYQNAFSEKKITPTVFAMLVDRILMKSAKMQLYGTQVIVNYKNNQADLYPLESPDSIDVRRISIGMKDSISEYLKGFEISWDIEKYKKQLPALKTKYKIRA